MRRRALPVLLLSLALTGGCDYRSGGVELLPPEPPVLSLPANGSTDEPNAVFLEWNESLETASYQIQVADNENFTEPIKDAIGLLRKYSSVKELVVDSTYYWRVRAGNEAGLSGWSEVWSFTPSSIARRPGSVNLIYPPHGTIDLPTTVVFKWHPAANARFYHLQAALENDFLRTEADMEALPDTTQSVSGLVFAYWYYWRVRAENATGFGPWSPAYYLLIVDAG